MKVAELIKALEKCEPDLEVYFEEEQTTTDDGIELGAYVPIDTIFEVGVRPLDSNEEFKLTRVILSNENGALGDLGSEDAE